MRFSLNIGKFIGNAKKNVGNFVSDVQKNVGGFVSNAASTVTSGFGQVTSRVGAVASTIGGGVTKTVGSVAQTVASIPQKAATLITDVWDKGLTNLSNLASGITDFAGNIGEGAVSIFKKPVVKIGLIAAAGLAVVLIVAKLR